MWNLRIRESEYFNEQDTYLCLTNMGKYYVTEMQRHNGFWYTVVGMQIKGTTILCINCRELLKKTVKYRDTEVKGQTTKFLQPDQIGINWENGKAIKEYGLPNYWNDVENLKI